MTCYDQPQPCQPATKADTYNTHTHKMRACAYSQSICAPSYLIARTVRPIGHQRESVAVQMAVEAILARRRANRPRITACCGAILFNRKQRRKALHYIDKESSFA